MATASRKPFQGVGNIIRFNWHFYAGVLGMLVLLLLVNTVQPDYTQLFVALAGFGILAATIISLAVSYYVYDRSPLYDLDWLDVPLPADATIVSINAGFDEISFTLEEKHPSANLVVLDFYNPGKHTEVSIKRARKMSAVYPGTRSITTADTELSPSSANLIICFLSAHEIRDADERTVFFRQLNSALKENGKIVVVEHLRDLPNFLAYNIGAFHFHSKHAWKRNFDAANLRIENEQAITPFITVFTLCKHGDAS